MKDFEEEIKVRVLAQKQNITKGMTEFGEPVKIVAMTFDEMQDVLIKGEIEIFQIQDIQGFSEQEGITKEILEEEISTLIKAQVSDSDAEFDFYMRLATDLTKATRDQSKLVEKTITDKNGYSRKVWVLAEKS